MNNLIGTPGQQLKSTANHAEKMQVQAKFLEGFVLHQKGQLTQAQAIYEQVIKLQPRHFDALHLAGVIAAQMQKFSLALVLIGKAIEINPNDPVVFNNLGNAFRGLKRHQAAVDSYDKAIALKPDDHEAHYNRGNALNDLKQYEAAIDSYNKVIVLQPDHAEAYSNRGAAWSELGDYQAAIESYDKAIAIKPGYAVAYYNRGNALNGLQQYLAAVDSFDKAIAIKPDYAQAYYNRGIALSHLRESRAAIESYDKAIAIKSDYAQAYLGRGVVLRGLNQHKAALESYDKAIAIKPDFAEAYYNCGVALREIKQYEAAINSYEIAISIRPGYGAGLFSQSLCYLQTGNFTQGWQKYEWRWDDEVLGQDKSQRNFAQPLWLGRELLRGKTILLHSEQGLGDTIQFCRYAKLVGDLGAQVILEVQKPLLGLLARLEGVTQLLARGDKLPAFDYQCPLMSLPLAFKTVLETIPVSNQYLVANPGKVAQWAAKLGGKSKPRVGLVWRGSADHKNDSNRSITLSDLITHLPRQFQYVSLQKEFREADQETLSLHPEILQFSKELTDFTDTAALCELMDVVLSVDTSVAHLAGALGKPTVVLLPFNPDWRWLLDREDSPWYPSVKLIRQQTPANWSDAFEHLTADLMRKLMPEHVVVADQRQPASVANQLLAAKVQDRFIKAYAGFQKGELAQAQTDFEQVLQLQPTHFDALHFLGVIAAKSKSFERALQLFDKAIEVYPDDASIHNNRGNVLKELALNLAAIESFERAVFIKADYAEAYCNCGVVFKDLERYETAIESFNKAIAIKPDYAEAYNNSGLVFHALRQYETAISSYDRAIALNPMFAQAYSNRGVALNSLKQHFEATDSYKKAIAIQPEFALPHFNQSLCYLQMGNFGLGWEEYEWRLRCEDFHPYKNRRDFAQRPWLGGESLQGKAIFLHCEQGLGDTIQFCRYAKLVSDLGARVILEVQKPLVSLLANLEGVAELVAQGDGLPVFDYQCPLLSLPLAFKTTLETIPAAKHYIAANPGKVAQWGARLGDKSSTRVGLVWSGRAGHQNDRNRSIALSDLITHLPGQHQYISLQKEFRDADRETLSLHPEILQFAEELTEFTDTAALCELMDVVLSVDTSVAHLAGALGKPVLVLLPFNPDWRWLLDREDSPWYPSAKLIRQKTPGNWADVFEHVKADLIKRLAPDDLLDNAQFTPDADHAAEETVDDGFMEGLALYRKGQLAQAQTSFEQFLELHPTHFEALQFLGVIAATTKNFTRALQWIDKAIDVCPNDASNYNNRGNVLKELAQDQAAIDSFERAIAIKPDYADAYYNLGVILNDLKRYETAIESFNKAVAIKPDHAEAYNSRGIAFCYLKRYKAAINSYDLAISISPDFVQAFSNRGIALNYLKQHHEAINSFDKAIALKPDYAEAYSNRGVAFRGQKQYRAAIHSYDKAISIRPEFAQAYSNRGAALNDLKQHDAAIDCYQKAIAIQPNYADAHFNQSLCHLQMGNFAFGWQEHEWRFRCENLNADNSKRNLEQPQWLGSESLLGKTILLHSEYGLGDTIQFCRYAKLVSDLGARVILEVQKPLLGLLASLEGVNKLLATGDQLPPFDFHCPLMSLPLAFKTTLETIPASKHYIAANVDQVVQWAAKLGDHSRPRIGLVWSGNAEHMNDGNRSIALSDLIAHLPKQFQYVSLQKEFRPADKEMLKSHPEILRFSEQLSDFTDTAALCELMDAVLSVDTSVAHLAGALGKPVLLLLPFNSDWRWLLNREDSPWYPYAKLFRQQTPDNWNDVFEHVKADLQQRFSPDSVADNAKPTPDSDHTAVEKAQASFREGFALHQKGQLAKAQVIYEQVLRIVPRHFDAMLMLGVIAHQAREPARAVNLIERAIEINPQFAAAHCHLGVALKSVKRYQAALASYDKALEIQPDFAEAHYNRALILTDLKQYQAAIESYGKAIAIKPNYAEAHSNCGIVLRNINQQQAAIDSYDRAIAINPNFAEAYANRGNALKDLLQHQAAIDCYDKAIAIKPNYAEAHFNRGVAFKDLMQHQAAIESYERALAIKPDYAECHWNQGLCYLRLGNFARGWQKYEWRWKRENRSGSRDDFWQPLWLGAEPLQGKTILLHSEQGLGDTIQFCRYAKQVKALGARVILEVQKPLLGLLANLAGVNMIIARGDPPPSFDFHCPLMSLPLAFKTRLDTMPAFNEYLAKQPDKVEQWRAILGNQQKPRVGLVWRGKAEHRDDANRSFLLAGLINRLPSDFQYVSLQNEYRDADQETLKSHPEILSFAEKLTDFTDTAALCELMDVVISVDTSLAHLAGALGKPVWVLLPFNPDWRWLLDREDSPWYPSAKLFRQDSAGDWDGVFERVKTALEKMCTHEPASAS